MKVEIVNYAAGNCHVYGSQVLYRATKFVQENDLDSDPEILWHTITQNLVQQNPDMLVLAAVDGNKVFGHLLCRLVNMDGMIIALVTQLAIDRKERDGREETIRQGLELVHQFAVAGGAKRVRCWAMNEKLATIFTELGFKPKDYVLMDIGLEAENG